MTMHFEKPIMAEEIMELIEPAWFDPAEYLVRLRAVWPENGSGPSGFVKTEDLARVLFPTTTEKES